MKVYQYDRKYKRDKFTCGKKPIDNYIQRSVTKEVLSGACTCFVILDDEEQEVLGYYTLATESISKKDAPERIQKKIRYPYIPVILLGRLAVHTDQMGNGIGKFLLANALSRSVEVVKDHIGAVAVVVDPIDQEAMAFYSKFGFTLLPDGGRMFMTIRNIVSALASSK